MTQHNEQEDCGTRIIVKEQEQLKQKAGEVGGFVWGGVEGRGENADNCN